MKLEVGKRYNDRDGNIIEIYFSDPEKLYQFNGFNILTGMTFSYKSSGHYADEEDSRDLVYEQKKLPLEIIKEATEQYGERMTWDAENPEDSFRTLRDICYFTGAGAIFTIQNAVSLPETFAVLDLNCDVHEFNTMEEAEEFSRLIYISGT